MASQQQQQQQQPVSPAEPRAGQLQFQAAWEPGPRGVPAWPPPPPPGGAALRPFERNLLRNPNPEGVNISEPAPPCLPETPCRPADSEGIFKGWQVSTEPISGDLEEASTRFVSQCYTWHVKQQRIDLLAEDLWEALLDQYQPNITVMDWYENSHLAPSVYELHVRLLGADEAVVIGEFHYVDRGKEQDQEEKDWHHVSHVFKDYGPGVRYVHFLHKTKAVETPTGLLRTRVTDSSVSVQLRD